MTLAVPVPERLGPRRRRPLPPADPALPQLATLLDPTAAAPILARSLPPERAIRDGRVWFADYVPGTRLTVRYELDVDGERHDAVAAVAADVSLADVASRPEHVGMALAVDGRSPAAAPLAYEADCGVLVTWPPLDLAMPALAEPPRRLAALLQAAGVEAPASEPARLGYRPGQRAVLRLGDHVLKVYADPAAWAAAVSAGLAVWRSGAVSTPRPEASLPALRATAQAGVPGTPGHAGDATLLGARAGELLRSLHGASLAPARRDGAGDLLRDAAVSGRLVSTLLPALARRVGVLLRELAADLPAGPCVPSHGDFNAGQLLAGPESIWMLDFDELCSAPPALDVAGYAANLIGGRAGDLEAAATALDGVCDGYGERPDRLGWFLSTTILRRAANPFRLAKSRWPARVELMIDAAEVARRW